MVGILRAVKALFTRSNNSTTASSARPGLEALEAREVPAVIAADFKTSSYGQKYLDIRSNDTASRVILYHPTASDGWNVNRNVLVIKDEANGFQKTVDLKTAQLSYISFTGGALKDDVNASRLLALGLVADGKGGDDIIRGGGGNDLLKGGAGNDRLEAGGGNNKLYGGAGNDTLIAGGIYSYLEGGDGRDVFYRNNISSVQYRPGNMDSPLRNLLSAVLVES